MRIDLCNCVLGNIGLHRTANVLGFKDGIVLAPAPGISIEISVNGLLRSKHARFFNAPTVSNLDEVETNALVGKGRVDTPLKQGEK